MSEALAKAKAATAAAVAAEERRDSSAYSMFLVVASVQSNIAIAEALTRIADKYAPEKSDARSQGAYL